VASDSVGSGQVISRSNALMVSIECGGFWISAQASLLTETARLARSVGSSPKRRAATEMIVQNSSRDVAKVCSGDFAGSIILKKH
jgi:hypothetical protein